MSSRTVLLVDKTRRFTGWSPGPEALASSLQRFVDECFAPVWGTACVLQVATDVAPGAWVLAFFDDPDQPGLLGVHELAPSGLPLSKVAVGSVQRVAHAISVIASHELVEMLVNPDGTAAVRDDRGQIVALECCDPVGEDVFLLDGLPICDFVFPAWFGPTVGARYADPDGKLDYLGRATQPFEPLPRGYIPVFDGARWSRRFGCNATSVASASAERRGQRGALRVSWRSTGRLRNP